MCRFDVIAPTKNRTDFSTNMSKCGKEIAVSVVCYMPFVSQIAECIFTNIYIYIYIYVKTNMRKRPTTELYMRIYIVFWLLYASFLQPEYVLWADHDADIAQYVHIDSHLNSFIESNISYWLIYIYIVFLDK